MSSPDELKRALFALEQAVQKLNDLEKDVFLEVAAFAKPHWMVRDVGLCVIVLKGSKDVTWMGAKAMMADTDFLRSLVEFEMSTLTDTQVKHVKAYISKNAIELEALQAISTAGTALLAWVLAIIDYYAVVQGKASSSVEADGAVDYTSSFPYLRGGWLDYSGLPEDYGGLPGRALSLGDDDGDDELISVCCVAWAPDGASIAVARANGKLAFVDVTCLFGDHPRTLLRELRLDSECLRCVAWAPDGARLAAGGADKKLMILDAASGVVEREVCSARASPSSHEPRPVEPR